MRPQAAEIQQLAVTVGYFSEIYNAEVMEGLRKSFRHRIADSSLGLPFAPLTASENLMNASPQDLTGKEPGAAWRVRLETPADEAQVEALNAEGFGPGRFAKSAYRLREGVAPVAALSFVAVEKMPDGGEVLRGSVRFWPIRVGGHEELLLGPLAVQSDQRGRGIGIALMQAGIAAAQQGSWRAILLVGDEPYYTKVGFSRLPPGRVKFPGPVDQNRILGLSLKAGELLTLSGEVRRAQIDEPVCADGAGTG